MTAIKIPKPKGSARVKSYSLKTAKVKSSSGKLPTPIAVKKIKVKALT